jgi:hypothetical protein
MFDASHFAGFAWGTVWGNAGNQSTPYLLGMAGNQVFIKTDVPSSVSHASRPQLYTAIQDVQQLQAMQNDLAGRYALVNHIDASATAGWNLNAGIYNGFAPIGSNSDNTDATRFTGSFDGLGHSIRDLTVNVTQPQPIDGTKLRGPVWVYRQRCTHCPCGPGQCQHQGIGGNTNSGRAGGENNGAIVQSHATGNATAEGQSDSTNYAGALVGANIDGSISQSYATGSAAEGGGATPWVRWWGGTKALSSKAMPRAAPRQRASNSAGALVGVNINGSISQSYATGSATAKDGNANFAGALAGRTTAASAKAMPRAAPAKDGNANSAGALVGKTTAASAKATGARTAIPGSQGWEITAV